MPTDVARRVLTAAVPGSIALDIDLPVGRLDVTVSEQAEQAKIELAATDHDAAREALKDATLDQSAGKLTVRVPVIDSADDALPNAQVGNGNSMIISGGVVMGNVTIGAGRNVVIGRNITVQRGGKVIHVSGSGNSPSIIAKAILPLGSTLRFAGQVTDVRVTGAITQVDMDVMAGNVEIEDVRNAWISSTTGDITVDRLDSATLTSTIGDITVDSVADRLLARATTGNIRVASAAVVEAATSTGDITVDRLAVSGKFRATTGGIRVTSKTADVRAMTSTGNITLTGDGVTLSASQARSAVGRVRVR